MCQFIYFIWLKNKKYHYKSKQINIFNNASAFNTKHIIRGFQKYNKDDMNKWNGKLKKYKYFSPLKDKIPNYLNNKPNITT